MRVAILDDYQNVALRLADWSAVARPLSAEILQQLPRLRMIASTGSRNASIDMQAAAERGILVTATGYDSTPTIEHTWALILASARHLVRAGSPAPPSMSSTPNRCPPIIRFGRSTTCW